MKSYFLIISVFLFYKAALSVVPSDTNRELSFKITYHNYHLGNIKAIKHTDNAADTYSVLAKAEGDLFFRKIVSENSIFTVFENKELVKSTTIVKRNGKTLNNTHTTFLKDKYIISTVEKTSELLNNSINFTVALMYFQEPVNVNSIYSEAWGKVLPLISNKNQYTFSIPDGTVCTFKYKEGMLIEVSSQTIIGEIKFTKEEPIILTVSK